MGSFPVTQVLSTLLSIFVLLAILNYCHGFKTATVEIPTNLEAVRVFSNAEIAKYDGSDPDQPIYMAVKGVVFDVTTGGKNFYGKGAGYNILVGKDSTRAVAKMSLDPSDLTNDIDGLSDSQIADLDNVFDSLYKTKYPVVGYMDYQVEKQEGLRHRMKQDL